MMCCFLYIFAGQGPETPFSSCGGCSFLLQHLQGAKRESHIIEMLFGFRVPIMPRMSREIHP